MYDIKKEQSVTCMVVFRWELLHNLVFDMSGHLLVPVQLFVVDSVGLFTHGILTPVSLFCSMRGRIGRPKKGSSKEEFENV